MLSELIAVAAILAVGNVVWRHFDPFLSVGRRLLKAGIALAATALISYFFGRTGVLIAGGLMTIPLIYVHGFWLPRHGVNGWTGEPRDRYYELRGWSKPVWGETDSSNVDERV